VDEILDKILPQGKGLLVPIDHPVSSYPVTGLEDIENTLHELSPDFVNAVVAHKGVVSSYSQSKHNFLMHLSASTVHSGNRTLEKVNVGTVEEAKQRGAIGVSVQVNLGTVHENNMLERLGQITTDAYKLKMPCLGMIYPRGPHLVVEKNDPTKGAAHAVRLAYELGCNMVKTIWTGEESFPLVVEAAPIPVFIAGGPTHGTIEELFDMIYAAMQSGAAGVCMGRQIFSNPRKGALIQAISKIIHDGFDSEEAMKYFEDL
tara:strand:- start:2905 stop:3684 length:780 start_codon:yes stop_codon:yes gene_type:complete